MNSNDKQDSHGSHGGNRGSGESRKDDPNRATNSDTDSQTKGRNDDRAGGEFPGKKSEMFEEQDR